MKLPILCCIKPLTAIFGMQKSKLTYSPAELLMPEAAMRHEIIPPVTLTGIARLKLKWKVSIQALIRRAYELSIITANQYKYLFTQLSARGWRTREPVELLAEKP